MSEFDENKTPNNEPSENTEKKEEFNQNVSSDSTSSQPQGQGSSNQGGANGYSPYNNGYNNPQNNGGYYGQSNPNNQSYGYGRTPNYVYYGQNSQQNHTFHAGSPYNAQNGGYTANDSYVPAHNEKGKKNGLKIFIIVVAVIAALSVFLTVFSIVNKKDSSKVKVDGPTLSASESGSASETDSSGELTAVGVYNKVKESSVGVLVYSNNGANMKSGEGSGVIVGEDKDGKYTYIITCAHVVSDGGTIKVQLYDDSQYDATLIGYDAKTDIAVMRIAKTGLKAIEIGDSDSLSVGETIYAIGNPGGVDFAGSFTNGMVSAIARPINSSIGYEMECIQHTAAINPGNSGGALVNSKGQLVGINSSKISSTDYEGMGFSVPSSTFVDVYNDIIEHGYVTDRAKLGITYTPAQASQTYSMLVGVKGLPAGTLVIKSITTDSPLVNTQVAPGDLITKVNGEDLDTTDKLPDLIENSKVGDKLTLTICHVDNNYQITEFEVTVALVEDKGNNTTVAEESSTQSYNPFGYFYNQGQSEQY